MSQFKIKNLEELSDFAKKLALKMQGSEVLQLVGDVGAGKTTFVQYFGRALNVKDDIVSPTFNISRKYQGEKLRLFHYDFYRLDEPGIMASELQEALQDPQAIVVVEWADIVQNVLPEDSMCINFTVTGETERLLTFSNAPEGLEK